MPSTAVEACLAAFAAGRAARAYSASSAELIGAVRADGGGWVVDGTVVLRDPRTGEEHAVPTSASGFRLTARPGRYEIRASAPGTEDIHDEVELREGEQTWWFRKMGPRHAR